MGIQIKRIISLLIVSLFVFLPFCGFVSADGGVFYQGVNVSTMSERSQYAVINYIDGIEHMYLTIKFDWSSTNKSAWIVPIPSEPDRVNVSLVKYIPVVSGSDDVVRKAKENLYSVSSGLLAAYALSALIPVPIIISMLSSNLGTHEGAASGIYVSQHQEKYGLTVEIISATGGQGIYNYLTSKDLGISQGTVPQLDTYVEKKYSFMVMWLSESELTIRQPGVILKFPTSNIYYPLILC